MEYTVNSGQDMQGQSDSLDESEFSMAIANKKQIHFVSQYGMREFGYASTPYGICKWTICRYQILGWYPALRSVVSMLEHSSLLCVVSTASVVKIIKKLDNSDPENICLDNEIE